MSRNVQIILTTFIFIIFVGVVSIFFLFTNKDDTIHELASSYQYQEFDPSSNTISTGFVTLSKKLSEEEFISYQNKDLGSTIIISEFADSQYECSGSCVCGEPADRRSTTVLTRSLYLLFSAVSSSLAFKIAERTFNNQCLAKFSSTCDEENISSEVQSCSEAKRKVGRPQKEEGEEVDFFCTGYCLPKTFRSPSSVEGQKEYFKREGKCEELKTSGNVKIERIAGNQKRLVGSVRTGKTKEYEVRFVHMNHKAVTTFMSSVLTKFCKEMSVFEYEYVRPNGRYGSVSRRGIGCMSQGDARSFIGGIKAVGRSQYDNIRCNMISENKNVEYE